MSTVIRVATMNRTKQRPVATRRHYRRVHFPFLHLPRELRDMIYRLLLLSESWIGLRDQVDFKKKRLLGGCGLLTTNWQVHLECLDVVGYNEILVSSITRTFEVATIQLTMPVHLWPTLRHLCLHLWAPELKKLEHMETVKDTLMNANILRERGTFKLDIFPFEGDEESHMVLAGPRGQYVLRKGLSVLKDVRICGAVRIRLVGNHQLCLTGKNVEKSTQACKKIIKHVEEAITVKADEVVRDSVDNH